MPNTTRHDPNSIGELLAAKILRLQRRTRPRRRAKRRAKCKKPTPDPRMPTFENRLGQTEIGRRILRLMDDLAPVKIAEDVARYGLDDCESTEAKLQERLCALAPMRTAEAY